MIDIQAWIAAGLLALTVSLETEVHCAQQSQGAALLQRQSSFQSFQNGQFVEIDNGNETNSSGNGSQATTNTTPFSSQNEGNAAANQSSQLSNHTVAAENTTGSGMVSNTSSPIHGVNGSSQVSNHTAAAENTTGSGMVSNTSSPIHGVNGSSQVSNHTVAAENTSGPGMVNNTSLSIHGVNGSSQVSNHTAAADTSNTSGPGMVSNTSSPIHGVNGSSQVSNHTVAAENTSGSGMVSNTSSPIHGVNGSSQVSNHTAAADNTTGPGMVNNTSSPIHGVNGSSQVSNHTAAADNTSGPGMVSNTSSPIHGVNGSSQVSNHTAAADNTTGPGMVSNTSSPIHGVNGSSQVSNHTVAADNTTGPGMVNNTSSPIHGVNGSSQVSNHTAASNHTGHSDYRPVHPHEHDSANQTDEPVLLCDGEGPPNAMANIIKRDIDTYSQVASYKPGLVPLIPKDADTVILDFSNAFASAVNQRVSVLVTQTLSTGVYLDGVGELAEYGSMEDSGSYFELALDLERNVLDIYQPALGLRTSDPQSKQAVEKATGDGWLGSMPLLSCPEPQSEKIVVDGTSFIGVGFFIFPMDDFINYRVTTSKAYATNFNIGVELLGAYAVDVTFSMMVLPPVTMKPRASDTRLLFFTTDYKDLGYHQANSHELPSDAVDRQTTTIWRHDLTRLPDSTIRVYVDPTVPERWRQSFREGIEAWNDAFKLLPQTAFIKGVCPGDEDWPADYDVADARFSTVAWSISEDVASIGLAKVDPRSGEIIKGDVIMADGWVYAYLHDLDLLAPGITHEIMGTSSHERRQLLKRQPKRPSQGDASEQAHRNSLSNGLSLLSAQRLTNGTLSSKAVETVLGDGLRSIVMHEVGHILGLRHMFKGSLYTTHDCLQNVICTAEQGLGATVMDYVPLNFPDPDVSEVHFFTPVIGAYDKLAIRYGYSETSHAALEQILEEAEQFDVCYDDDNNEDQDPFCATEDLGPDPVAFHQSQFDRLVRLQSNLLEATVQPGGSYQAYGHAVELILRQTEMLMSELLPWIGGIENFYSLKDNFNPAARHTARKPVSIDLQRHAVKLLLQLLHLDKQGLLPGQAGLPYLVDGDMQWGLVYSVDITGEAENLTGKLAQALLSTERLEKLRLQEELLGESSAVSALTVQEYLNTLNEGILAFSEVQLSNLEMQVQQKYIARFVRLYLKDDLPAELKAETLMALQSANAMVNSALGGNQTSVTTAHVSVLTSLLSKVFCQPGEICASPKVWPESDQVTANPLDWTMTSADIWHSWWIYAIAAALFLAGLVAVFIPRGEQVM